MDLPLRAPISTSLKLVLGSIGLDMAEVEVKMFEFAIFLLDTTIQNGGMRERSVAV